MKPNVDVREPETEAEWEHVRRALGHARLEAGDTLLVAWAGSRPVGRLELRWQGSKHEHVVRRIGRVPEICRMRVAEQFRGHGIAGRLLVVAKQLARARGIDQVGLAVGLENYSALAAYEKAAFTRSYVPHFESPFGQNGAHTVVYMTASTGDAADRPMPARQKVQIVNSA